ncbi:MAG: 4-hydroxythreonine-4-phosphate dehydrogenase PdxA [Desulfovibrionaceae bacterium]|nr:4-hydroxythreonine-4-phosphate dehydrogenase PdxA [Desulfovibrionaceae bacterium]
MRTLCVTLGDPAGLGPELVARTLSKARPGPNERLLILGPLSGLAGLRVRALGEPGEIAYLPAGVYAFEPPGLSGLVFRPGLASPEGGLAAGLSLEAAISLLGSGVCQGLVTCPLNKAMLQAAGFDFPGHTEFLAQGLGVGRDNVCMHLCGPRLRVSLVTTHPPLKDVPGLITRERILRCLRLTSDFVRGLGHTGPLAVCGLNPHAGESGRIGREEIEVIGPAVDQAKSEGLDVVGPLAADTVFYFAARGDYAAVLAMYHDQGLGPLKLLHFSEAVNVTLGLPCPRTSPDHGTGYDLVGTGRACLDSFKAALDLARRMVAGTGR